MRLWMIGCLLLPLLGTVLGAGSVFFVKGREMPWSFYGLTAGMMLAAVWILLAPALDGGCLPAAVGLLLGSGSLYWADRVTEKYPTMGKGRLLMLAITLHNFPEGMAVGIALAGAAAGNAALSVHEAVTMALAVAVQNFPDGIMAALPLRQDGSTKGKAFFMGTCSGLVEPVTALASAYLTGLVGAILPYVLAYAAGAMLYVVAEELLPRARQEKRATAMLILGFTFMLLLEQ